MEESNNKSIKIEEFTKRHTEYFREEDLELVKYRLLNLKENQLLFLDVLKFNKPNFLIRNGPKKYNFDFIMSQIDFFEDENNKKPENQKQSKIEMELTEKYYLPAYKKIVNAMCRYYELEELPKDEKKTVKNLVENLDCIYDPDDFNLVELEKSVTIEKDREAVRIEAYRNMLRDSYFLEQDAEEKPYTSEEINELLNKGQLKVSSKIKLGYFIKEYSPLINFKEFNQGFKEFL